MTSARAPRPSAAAGGVVTRDLAPMEVESEGSSRPLLSETADRRGTHTNGWTRRVDGSRPVVVPPSADDSRGVGGDYLAAQLERVRNRLRRGRRRALGLAPPSERPFAGRARDDPRAPLSGRLVPEPRQLKELEGIVVGGLVPLRPAH